MNKTLSLFHVAILVLFTISLVSVLKYTFGWSPDLYIGLIVALVLATGIFEAVFGYMILVWVLGFIPHYPWTALFFAVLMFISWVVQDYLPGSEEMNIWLVGVIGVVLFYMVFIPEMILGNWGNLLTNSVLTGLYAVVVSLYYKNLSQH